jgi:hypothetical protein
MPENSPSPTRNQIFQARPGPIQRLESAAAECQQTQAPVSQQDTGLGMKCRTYVWNCFAYILRMYIYYTYVYIFYKCMYWMLNFTTK